LEYFRSFYFDGLRRSVVSEKKSEKKQRDECEVSESYPIEEENESEDDYGEQ
jgi:hypothetical protein